MSPDLGPSLTRSQVATLLSVHPATVTKWAKRGLLPYFATPSGQLRFLRADVEALMRTQQREAS